MNKPLPPDLEEFVKRELDDKNYPSRDELYIDAVRALRERKNQWDRLKAEIDAGRSQLESGQGISIDGENELREFFEEIKATGAERYEAKKGGS